MVSVLHPRRCIGLLLGLGLLLSLAGLEVVLARHLWGDASQHGLSKIFDLDAENNLPTWFLSACLLLCAIALWLIGNIERPRRPNGFHWFGIAAVFVLMSLDETASFHEQLDPHIRRYLHTGEFFHFAWVIPGALFVLGFLAVTFGFLRRLPADTRRRFLMAGFIYVSGSLGLEMLGGNYEFVHGKRDLTFGLLGVAEETLEMLGAILFLRALLLYLSRRISHSGTCADDELIA